MLAENKEKDYQIVMDDLYYQNHETRNDYKKLALEAYAALSLYEDIITRKKGPVVTPPTDSPPFDSFCLFGILNLLNSGLSESSQGKKQASLLQSIEINPPCKSIMNVVNFSVENGILIKSGKKLIIPHTS